MLKPAVPVGHIFFGFLFFTAASFICAHKIENRCKLYHVCGLMKKVIKKSVTAVELYCGLCP